MSTSSNRSAPRARSPRPRGPGVALGVAFALGAALAAPPPAGAGGTPDPGTATSAGSTLPDQLLHQAGENRLRANGDWVSDNDAGALNTFYQYFIEVPPGQANLTIQIYDADAGNGGSGDFHDGLIGGLPWNTTTIYQIFDPTGASPDTDTVAPATCNNVPAGCDNAWVDIFVDSTSPLSGHWRVTVNTSTDGNDHNNYGLRAHDGNSGAGGTEYNVYAQSYIGMGESSPDYTTNRDYDFFPYVYRGCTVDFNDFDSDDGGGNDAGAYDLTTRAGNPLLTGYDTLSGNDAWNNNAVTGFTSDFAATDYGLWRLFFQGAAPAALVNNVYTIYVGADNSPNPPPTTQPVASAARIYLPADGSSYANGSGTINVPVKPHVGHSWAKVAGEPPIQIGVTTRIEVTVTVTNPAAFPILFSSVTGSGDRVIATVPTNSGQTAYVAGSASVSQGAVAATGTGPWTINWGPGSVAAGATATLTYRIDVTPTGAGTLQLTGDPAGTIGPGTTATFVDETCSTTTCSGARLTTATFTFGPLCELRATVQDLTPALIAGFRARAEGGGVVVEWETAAEAGTLAFDLYRREGGRWRRVAERPLAAVQSAPQGGVYRLSDPGASPRERQTYLLVERAPDGARQRYGPFTVEPIWERAPGAAPADPYHAAPRRQAGAPAAQSVSGRSPADVGAAAGARSEPPPSGLRAHFGARLGVAAPGIYRVEAAELAPLLDFPPPAVASLIANGALSLAQHGLAVAWWDGGGAVEFYGEGIASPFARENAYILTLGPGVAPAAAGATPLAPAPAGLSFRERLDAEQDLRPVVLLPLDPEGDTWFWEILQAGHSTNAGRTFALAVPGLAPGAGPAELTVRLQGGSSEQHEVSIEVNGAPVGTVALPGTAAAAAVLELPAGLLAAGANQVTVTATAGGFVLVDGFGLAYDRLYQAEGSRLVLRGDGHRAVTVRGLGAGARVLEVSDPLRPAWVAAVVEPDGAGSFQATFAPRAPDAVYLAYDPGFVRRPPTVVADHGTGLLARGVTGAEYLILAPAGLLEAAARLAAHRGAEGLSTMVLDLQAVYDEVSFGVSDPRAIRDFVAAARKRWVIPPRYLVLAGAGTYDYRDNLGLGGNLIPPLLALSDLGPASLYATDALYGDLDGDGVPEVAVGRIPVTDAAGLAAYIDKLIAYETALVHPGAERVVLAADGPDPASDFRAGGEAMAARLPGGFAAEPVWLSDFATTADARAALFGALGEGAGALVYLGHGGADRLAGVGLLTNADVPGLGNGDRLPVVSAVTCHIGLFALPGFDALGELLVRQPDGGAIAVFAPAWLSNHAGALGLGEALLRRLTETDARLGDAVREAAAIAAGLGTSSTTLHTYQLFGDPALRPRLAPAPLPPSGGDPDPGGA